jgi:hypothetical protein
VPTVVLPPTVDDLADWLKVPADTAGLEDALTAAIDGQAAACIVDPYYSGLREAALHRAAREWSSRPFPLGTQDIGDWGPVRIGRDPLIAELEADYRRGPFG